MASIRKRGDRWQVRWQRLDGTGSECCTVGTHDEGAAAERAIVRAHRSGREWQPETASPRARLDKVAATYQDARRHLLRQHTLRMEGAHLDVFLRFCGERHVTHLDELGRPLLDDFLAWLLRPGAAMHKRTRKQGSAARIVEAALHLWQWADDSGRFQDVPRAPHKIELPRSRPPPVVAPTWAEMDACILALTAGTWQRRLATWLRWTGLRAGESMAFLWTDLDLERGLLTIRPEVDKNKVGRIVPLAAGILDEIATWGVREGYLLPCARKEGEREREARGRDATRAWKRAGVREAAWRAHPWHAFRRGFKSGLLAMGAHPDAVDYLQGHSLGSGSRGRYIDGLALPLHETLARIPLVGGAAGNVVPLVAVGQSLDRSH